ncbi:MAG: bifunctional tRNA pseudouridine(32) synthase/ribosomal large subunit pseudouridine synthase RluA [Pseudomonadales bacterium]|nr:bifunctional tRNA pseudouridine(32) synthase/ribosomal large subunit pseudouridine synthase RluA [Pseudomonadales bacterium]
MNSQPYYIVPFCAKEPLTLYQDKHLLLVSKPEFLLSVPGRAPENKDCLITRLQREHPSASIVHRLDLDTSGIMIIPLEKSAHSHISRQFQERQITKHYTAEVFGLIDEDNGCIELPIAKDWPNRPKQKIDFEKGKSAVTHWQVLKRFPKENKTRLLLKPVTGRTHQLRIHLREIGHPILGCDMYAHKEALERSPRLLLHATYITFTHPISGKVLFGYCPPEF